MQWPIVRGVYSDIGAEWRQGLPVNMVPVPIGTGISDGYLRPAEGIVKQADGLGPSRGGIVWDGALYRVMGGNFVRVEADGSVTLIGEVGAGGNVQMDYGFDYLGIAADGKLWLYNKLTLSQVTDPDAGDVQGVIWVDGYFMTTDGEFLIVTELTDPFSINPLKYGSAEADPDPVLALLKLRNEAYALNRHTVEVFTNVGGDNFPFARIEGAQIQRGVVGPSACCVFQDSIAFLGGGRNEPPSVYLGANGQSQKVATREIDKILGGYTEAELATAKLSERIYDGHIQLVVALSRDTLVYDVAASQVLQMPIWFRLSSSMDGAGRWLADTPLRAYDKWTVCHPTNGDTGYLTTDTLDHWGATVAWEFSTPVLYNEGRAAVIHDLELVALSGRDSGTVGTQYSTDGREWSNPRWVPAGSRSSRMQWRGQGMLRHWRVQRFFGTANIAPTRVEATVEGLAY
jgi:hypothetical protein